MIRAYISHCLRSLNLGGIVKLEEIPAERPDEVCCMVDAKTRREIEIIEESDSFKQGIIVRDFERELAYGFEDAGVDLSASGSSPAPSPPLMPNIPLPDGMPAPDTALTELQIRKAKHAATVGLIKQLKDNGVAIPDSLQEAFLTQPEPEPEPEDPRIAILEKQIEELKKLVVSQSAPDLTLEEAPMERGEATVDRVLTDDEVEELGECDVIEVDVDYEEVPPPKRYESATPKRYEDMTIVDLKELLKKRKLPWPKPLKKHLVIEVLEKADAEGA
jgi:hypothetical protein